MPKIRHLLPANLLTLAAIGLTGFTSASVARLSGAWARPSRAVPMEVRRGSQEAVGRNSQGQVVLPQNQRLTPLGRQVELPGLRPQALALSPDGRWLVTAGKTHEIVLVDPVTGNILQRVPLPAEQQEATATGPVSSHILEPDKEGQLSFTGLVFSPDGTRLYLSNVNGSIKVFGVTDGKISGLFSLPLPKTGLQRRQEEIPSGLAVSADGQRLYVALNLSNALLEMNAATGAVVRRFEVGALPYDVVLAGYKVYVSNWGGRRPDTKSVTGPAGQGTTVRVDAARYIASEGSVSVVDLDSGQVTREVVTGRHASALAMSPDGRYLVVANAAEDNLSVLEARTNAVVETISLRGPAGLFGASPDALSFAPDGATLYVGLGSQNAVAQIAFAPGHSQLQGLMPVGWFPGALVYDGPRRALYVANIKGFGSGYPIKPGEPTKFNSHQYFGTLSLVPLPAPNALPLYTRIVQANNGQAKIAAAQLPARRRQPPRPVPERVGEPSLIKHVIYVIKENRTYDQVLGDVKEGKGDASLCIFGADVTPNQHKLVHDFALLDNTYCSGILSADGHQWTDSAFATDYMERSFAGFPRSYPDGMEDNDVDAMAYSPTGFIWDNALQHGKTLRDYGEYTIGMAGWKDAGRQPGPRFLDFYHDFVQGTALTSIRSRPGIESLRPHICANTIGWDLRVPDVWRAARFIEELKGFEQSGDFPALTLICLPNDHTSGTGAGAPTPAAQVADNDLALGRIVDALSHSRFWKDTCLFAIEDDPQNGWDHISAFRTTAYVVSPYTRRHAVVSTQYNQPALLRTMELMLGLPPLNVMDAAATPMFDCFSATPDFTPYNAVPNTVPLDQMNPVPSALRDPLQKRYALLSAKLPLKEADQCPEDLLNYILWTARKGSRVPYPGQAKKGMGKRRDDD